MALEIGNLLGAAANLTTAFSKERSLKSFLKQIDGFGIQVTNNFEVNLFGLQDITFFVQSINFGGMIRKVEELHYNGRSIPIPTYTDYDHSGSMKVINDANGYIYAAVSNFLLENSGSKVDNGIVMTIKCLTGDKDYKGSLITLKSVFFDKLDGMSFDYSGGDISTFTLNFQYLEYSFTPGALAQVAGVVGAAESIIS